MDDFIPDEQILQRLEAELTEDLVYRLVGYCHSRCRSCRWYGFLLEPNDGVAGGDTPEDIVSTAITKTIEGVLKGPGRHRRSWSGQRDLYDHLTSVIDSDVSNRTNSWINNHFVRASQIKTNGSDEDPRPFFERVEDEATSNPEEVALRSEVEEGAEAFYWGFHEYLQDEEFLVKVIELIFDGARKPAEIAQELDVKVEEVYKARKRLRRRLADFRAVRSAREEV